MFITFRFQFGSTSFFGGGGKLSKHVRYPASLNIRPYMSNKNVSTIKANTL